MPEGGRVLAVLAIAGLIVTPYAARAQATCLRGTLPAYAHNDYQNPRPLYEALERGLRGVEVDLFLVEGELRLGHDRSEARRGASFEALYLAPLDTIVTRCATLTTDGRPFLLAIELKESSPAAYDSLLGLLARYQRLIAPTRGTQPPAEVVLVGWHPTQRLEQRADSLLRIQFRLTTRKTIALEDADGRVRMISVDYGKTIAPHWSDGTIRREWLSALRRVRESAPGRLLRVHNVPADATLYAILLDAGVDFIGTKDLAKTQRLLATTRP